VQAFGLQEQDWPRADSDGERHGSPQPARSTPANACCIRATCWWKWTSNDGRLACVKATPRVTGFVGTGSSRHPFRPEEVDQIVNRVQVTKDKPRLKVKYEKEETVRITEGALASLYWCGDDVMKTRDALK